MPRLDDSTTNRPSTERPVPLARAVAVVLCALALVAAARGLVRHNTWYLASDQFAFLTFADDLLDGSPFHDPAMVEEMSGPSRPRGAAVDAYYQTYIYRDGRLYSRYPPGYPMLLAAAKLAGGQAAEHWLNPALYLVLIVVVGRLASLLVAGHARWAAAATAMWALLVIPVEVHYWGITVARDLPAHLLALGAVLCGCAGAPAWAGGLLGLAATVRPDAILWGPAIALVLPRTVRGAGAVARGSLAFALGVLPLLAYNLATQGHPLAFTQGSEFRGMFESGLGLPTLLADASFVSGGGFRLIHFPGTFVSHVRYLAGSFGGFLWLAAGMLVMGFVRPLPVARALGSYVVIGLVFYSFWSHGDPRYLVGVSLSLIVLAAAAIVRIADWLADGTPVRARALALIVVCAVLLFGTLLPRDPARGLTTLEWSCAVALTAACFAGGLSTIRPAAMLLPALAFAGFGIMRMVASATAEGGFRAGDVARARATIEALVPPGALVLTSPAIGRPAENWTHYTHAEAHYPGELDRLFSDANLVALRRTLAGRPLYLLLGAGERDPFTVPRAWITMHEVARRDGQAQRDWFVDPQRAPAGVVLYEAKLAVTPPS